MRALVTDAHFRTPVHGIRALGRAGIEVIAVGDTRNAAGCRSRFATVAESAPSPREDPAAFAAQVARLAAAHGPAVVFPGREASLEALTAGHAQLPAGSLLASPSAEVLEQLRDKARLAEVASRFGIRAPRTLDVQAAGVLAERGATTPCVVKPVRPGQVLDTARVVRSPQALSTLLRSLPADETVLVQEHVDGPLTALSVVVDRAGRLVGRFQQRAIRTFPAGAGVSALAVGVAPSDQLSDRVAQLLRSIGFWGMVQLQFLGPDSDPVVIDANPRFFGSMPLAVASGVNLPALWHAVAQEQDVAAQLSYRVGVHYRWLEADLVAARRQGLSLLRPVRGPVVGAMWAGDDPVPGLVLAAEQLSVRARRLLRSRAR